MANNPFLEEVKESTNPFLDSPKVVTKAKNPFLEEAEPIKENPFLTESVPPEKPMAPSKPVVKPAQPTKLEDFPKTKEGVYLPQPSISMEEQQQFRKDLEEYRRKVDSGEISKAQLYAQGIPGPIRNVAKMLAMVALPASIPVGTGVTAIATAVGSGAAIGAAYETFDKMITEGRLPTKKEYAVSGGIGGAAGLIPYSIPVIKKIAEYLRTTPDDVVNIVGSAAKEKGIPAKEATENLVNNIIQEPEGVKIFRETIENAGKTGPELVNETLYQFPKYAGSINLNRINAPFGAKQLIQETAETIGKTPRSHEELLKETAEAGPWTVGDALQVENPMALSDVGKRQLREVMVNEAGRLEKLGAEATDDELLNFANIVAKDSHVASETGRTLAQRGLDIEYAEPLQEAKLKAFDKLTRSPKAADKEWLASKLRLIQEAKGTNAVIDVIHSALTSPLKKIQNAVEASIVNGYLSMPTTWLGVHLSQGIYTAEKFAQRPIAAAIDSFISLARGTGRSRFFSDAVVEAKSMWDAMPEAARYFTKSFTSQRQVFTEDVLGKQFYPRASFGNWAPGGIPVSKAVEKIVHVPGGSMIGAGDDAVKVLNYRGSLHVQAHQKALAAGLKGGEYTDKVAELINNPTSDMIEKASKESFDKAFQRELSTPAYHIGRGIHSIPIIGRTIQPFITVLDSGLRTLYERTPLIIPELAYKAATKQITQGEFADSTAKMIIGAILAGGAYTLAEKGMVTGGGPINQKDKQVWYAAGYKPYHVYLPNGYGVGYAKAEPLASILGTVADYHTIRDYADKTDSAAKIAWYAFGRNVLNKTWMTGLSNFYDGLMDPEKSGKSLMQQLSGAAIPQISYGIARVADPTLRQPRNLTEAFEKRIPGLSGNVPPIRDIWGMPVMDLRNGFAKMLDPLVIHKLDNDPTTQEVLRLHARITSPSDSIGEIPMTQEEYEYLLERKGRKSHEVLTRYMNNRFAYKGKRFGELSDLEKREAVEGIDQYVNSEARKMIELKVYKRMKQEGYTNRQYSKFKKGMEELPEEVREQGR